ncbi:MAG: hypothetical protein ACFCVE_14450 [Phycisphaerae bacterium]
MPRPTARIVLLLAATMLAATTLGVTAVPGYAQQAGTPMVDTPKVDTPMVDAPGPTAAASEGVAVDALLADLAAADWPRREAAQAALVDRGEPVLPALKQALSTVTDLESRSRIEAAIRQIDENARVGASRITLVYEDEPAKNVYDALLAQARAQEVKAADDIWKDAGTVSIELRDVNFFQAAEALHEITGLALVERGQGLQILRQRQFDSFDSAFTVYSGPFAIRPRNIHRSANITFDHNNQQNKNFSINVMVANEPKIEISRGQHVVFLETVLDNNGNDLVGGSREQRVYNSGRSAMQFGMELRSPENLGTHIATMKGRLEIEVETSHAELKIDDLSKAVGKQFTVDRASIEIVSLKTPEKDNVELYLTMRNLGMTQQQWQQVRNTLSSELRLESADGQPFNLRSFNFDRHGNDEMSFTISYRPSNPANDDATVEPGRLNWRVPTGTTTLDVPFEFADLPIPQI